ISYRSCYPFSSVHYWFWSYSFPSLFLFNATSPTEISTLSLHDALPILTHLRRALPGHLLGPHYPTADDVLPDLVSILRAGDRLLDRKSTRLNSSHGSISYAVFCLKKKNGRHGPSPSPSSAPRDVRHHSH